MIGLALRRYILAPAKERGPFVQKEVQTWQRLLPITRSCISSTLHRGRRTSPRWWRSSRPWLSSTAPLLEWGARKLAYPINYKNDGYYVLMTFTSGPEFPKELDRVLGITEGIMRSMIVCKGE